MACGISAKVIARAQRHLAGGVVTDAAACIGEKDVLHRRFEQREGGDGLFQIARVVEPNEGVGGAVVRGEARPHHGEQVAAGLDPRLAASGEIGDDRAVPGGADDQRLAVPATQVDGLLAQLEGARAVRRLVVVWALQLRTFDNQVLAVAVGRRHAPGDMTVVTEQDHRRARRGHPGAYAPGGLDAGQVPGGRRLQRQVGIAGQQRPAGRRQVAGQDPGVAGAVRAQQRRQGGQDRRGGQGGLLAARQGHRRARRQIGKEIGELGRRQALGQAPELKFVAPVVGQPKRHHLAPEHAVAGVPGLDLVAEEAVGDLEHRRQGALMTGQVGVDAGGVGGQQVLARGIEVGQGGRGDPGEAQGAHRPVEIERAAPGQLRQAALTHRPDQHHLAEAVLGMREAEAEGGVGLAGGANRENAVVVAQQLDRLAGSGDRDMALDLRQRGAQPEIAGDQRQAEQQEQRAERQPDSLKVAVQALHLSLSAVTGAVSFP
jgi:hypothetical protein